jgi:hypothetical protein
MLKKTILRIVPSHCSTVSSYIVITFLHILQYISVTVEKLLVQLHVTIVLKSLRRI